MNKLGFLLITSFALSLTAALYLMLSFILLTALVDESLVVVSALGRPHAHGATLGCPVHPWCPIGPPL